MSKAYYAVKKGRKPGIYTSWLQCEPQVHKFKGADFKGFNALKDAQEYLGTEESVQTSLFPPFIDDRKIEDAHFRRQDIVAYVDGSFNYKEHIGGYGLVLVKNSDVILKDLGTLRHPDLIKSGQIAGELLGALRAVELALANGYTHINIVYDYEGIRRFARSDWTANTFSTIDYQRTMKRYLQKVDVSFIKVKSHSGNAYNDLADQLAKRAVGIRN